MKIYVKERFLNALFLSGISIFGIVFGQDISINKAFRPDASTIAVNCADCCDTGDITDCQFNEAISLLDVIISDIDVLINIEESCCASATSSFEDLKSDIDSLTTFEQTCCAELNSKLESLATFQEICCSELNSKIDAILDCSCCDHIITQADIDTGTFTITAPGVYCLGESVTFVSGNAITISNTVEQVIFDLKGYTITGAGSGNAIFIDGATGGVTVENGAITGSANGIEISNSLLVFLKNIDISANTNYGVFIHNGSNGVEMYNLFVHSSGFDGIFADEASLCKVINSTIVLSNADALHLDTCVDWSIDTVRCVGNAGFGFHIDSNTGPSNSISFSNCTAESCATGGYFITSSGAFSSFNINYIACKALNLGGSGYSLLSGGSPIAGIVYKECMGSNSSQHGFATGNGLSGFLVNEIVFDACTSLENQGSGFFIDCNAAIVKNCIAESNQGDGITLTTNAFGCQVLSCSVADNANFGINDANTVLDNLIYSNTAISNGFNYSPIVPLKLLPTDITGHWINVDSTASMVGEYESKIDAILECSCCEHIITPNDIVPGGFTISGAGVYCLSSDVVYVNGPAITINPPIFNQIILDLGGHTITCDPTIGTGPTIQINAAGTGGSIIIRNGAFSGGDGNIIINQGQSIILQDLRFNFTTNGISPVVLNSCDNVLIQNIELRGGSSNGIEIHESTNCFVKDSLIEGCVKNGIYVNGSSNLTFENVQAFNNDVGIYLDGFSTGLSTIGVTHKNCIADVNRTFGFSIQTTAGSGVISQVSYADCTASNTSSGSGFYLFASGAQGGLITQVDYTNCISLQSGGDGFTTANDGAQADSITGVTYEYCQALGNSLAGFTINSDGIVLKWCIASNNHVAGGIELANLSQNCQVIACTATDNTSTGIQDFGTNNLVYSNTASNNVGTNYSPTVPLQLKPTDITGYWINVDPTSSSVGEYESKIDAILACSCCQNMITQANIDTGDFTIDTPGIYCLASDVTFSAGNAITIVNTPGEVILDLATHTITGSGAGINDAILVSNSNGSVIIRNGIINTAVNGVEINNTANVTVKNVQIYNATNNGIAVFNNSVNILIDGVTVSNSGADGIFIQTSGFSLSAILYTIQNSLLIQNGRSGFNADGLIFANIINTKAVSNGMYGFSMISDSNFVAVVNFENCAAELNASDGFYVTATKYNISLVTYTNCLSAANAPMGGSANGFGMLPNSGQITQINHINCTSMSNGSGNGFATGAGTSGSLVDSVMYDHCFAMENGQSGFFIDSKGAVLLDCVAQRNSDGITLNDVSSNAQVLRCAVSENNGIGIDDTHSVTDSLIYSNTAVANFGGNYSASVPLQLIPTDITGHWINVDPSSSAVGEYESKIDAILAATSISCGCCPTMITNDMVANGNSYIITEAGLYCLAEDITFKAGSSTDFAIQIFYSGPGEVTLDMRGHSITGSGDGRAIFINNSNDVNVHNGIIVAVDTAIHIEGSTRIHIDGINSKAPARYGMHINGGQQIVASNLIIDHAGIDGVIMEGTAFISLYDSEITQNALYGVRINSVSQVNIERVRCVGNGIYQFGIDAAGIDVEFKDCTAEYGNGGYIVQPSDFSQSCSVIRYIQCVSSFSNNPTGNGFALLPTGKATVSNVEYINCTATNDINGFVSGTGSAVNNVVYTSCIAQGNTTDGFFVNSNESILKNCISENNGNDGIRLEKSSTNCIVQDCTTSFNRVNGINVLGVADRSESLIEHCIEHSGSSIERCADHFGSLIQHCTSNHNGRDGILLDVTTRGNQVFNCYCCNNLGVGVRDSGKTNYVFGNAAFFNSSGNFSPAPTGAAITVTSAYWGNVRETAVP